MALLSKQMMGVSITQKSLIHLTPRSMIQSDNRRRSLVIRSQNSGSNSSRRLFRSLVSSVTTGELMKETPINTDDEVEGRSFGSQVKVRAVVTVRNKNKEDLKEAIFRHVDALTDRIGKNVVLQLVSTDIDPRTRGPKKSAISALKDWSKKSSVKAERVNYTAEFLVDSNFGMPGAILVTNKHQQEFFLESITIEGFVCGPIHLPCNSWVQSNKNVDQRVFFNNHPYLPDETPEGLKALREKELKELRGNGTGERKSSDRIYDYDVYNDLGNPDSGVSELSRPVLGGEKIPYPRRCRTGRPPSETDMNVESRAEKPFTVYVPRDEQFEESKAGTFSFCRLKAVLHNLWPSLTTNISAKHDFSGFLHLDSLFNEGLLLKLGLDDEELLSKLPKFVSKIQATSQELLKFETPMIVSKDKHAWMRDDEFARQFVAGVNPMSIQRLQAFPPVSKLDPETYGPPESAIKEEHILGQLDGLSVKEALDSKRLFIADYHDTFLPFLDRINALEGRKTYATRALFFRTSLGTLKPVAIELTSTTCCSNNDSSKRVRVITPPVDATSFWIWQLAKAHVCSNDAGVHQLVHHWLRTHASLEPFILAAHRRLSQMHPIFKLLDPHMRYTLEINALARQRLVNADGVIEACFTPGRYSMEISAAAYKDWRFDLEGLPSDLLRRGMAEPDPSQPHGIKLVLEDYPYAADGLLIWDAIQTWVTKYVTRYYPDPTSILHDQELQGWYYEAVNVGHADLRDADWWPNLDTQDSLIKILTILIWLGSAQHAALNFGQYPYGGYIPNRPVLVRRLIPEESSPEFKTFLDDPQRYYMSSLPSVLQTSKFIAVIDTLSTHSPDEEYLGERAQPSTWTGDGDMVHEFFAFSAEMGRVEKKIDERNADPENRNRCGAGVMPYELMAPTSEPGVTGRGVPNSVTI